MRPRRSYSSAALPHPSAGSANAAGVDFETIADAIAENRMAPLESLDPDSFKDLPKSTLSQYIVHFGVQSPATKPVMKRALRSLQVALVDRNAEAVEIVRRQFGSASVFESLGGTPDYSKRTRQSSSRSSVAASGSTSAAAPSQSAQAPVVEDPAVLFGRYVVADDAAYASSAAAPPAGAPVGGSAGVMLCSCSAVADEGCPFRSCSRCCGRVAAPCAVHARQVVHAPTIPAVMDRNGDVLESLELSAVGRGTVDIRGVFCPPGVRPSAPTLVPKGCATGDIARLDIERRWAAPEVLFVSCPNCYEEFSADSSAWTAHMSLCCPDVLHAWPSFGAEMLEYAAPPSLKRARSDIERRVALRGEVLAQVFNFEESLLHSIAAVFARPLGSVQMTSPREALRGSRASEH